MELEKLEKKELGTLVNVIKNKKQIENKTKELTFSTAKNKSRMRKKYSKRKEGSIYSMDSRRLQKQKTNPIKQEIGLPTKISSRKKLILPKEEHVYNFVKINENQSSNK